MHAGQKVYMNGREYACGGEERQARVWMQCNDSCEDDAKQCRGLPTE